VLDVVNACAARWVLGMPPVHERDVAVWRQSLGVADRGPRGLLDVAAAVSAGTTLPGLEAIAEDDRASWDAFVARTTDPKSRWDWRRRTAVGKQRSAWPAAVTRLSCTRACGSATRSSPLVNALAAPW
jgi:hypothetical protein